MQYDCPIEVGLTSAAGLATSLPVIVTQLSQSVQPHPPPSDTGALIMMNYSRSNENGVYGTNSCRSADH